VVMELFQTNLFDAINSNLVQFDLGMKINIAKSISLGMNHLHRHCYVIHRDLKSLNILLRSNEEGIEIKICDFGISRVIDAKTIMTGNVGTVAWVAPEVFEQKKI